MRRACFKRRGDVAIKFYFSTSLNRLFAADIEVYFFSTQGKFSSQPGGVKTKHWCDGQIKKKLIPLLLKMKKCYFLYVFYVAAFGLISRGTK